MQEGNYPVINGVLDANCGQFERKGVVCRTESNALRKSRDVRKTKRLLGVRQNYQIGPYYAILHVTTNNIELFKRNVNRPDSKVAEGAYIEVPM